jgi:hypothetical protein
VIEEPIMAVHFLRPSFPRAHQNVTGCLIATFARLANINRLVRLASMVGLKDNQPNDRFDA